MTTYTDIEGKSVILCDHCRADMPQGSPAFMFLPGTVAQGYVSRDYEKSQIVLCPACTKIVDRIMVLMGLKHPENLTTHQDEKGENHEPCAIL